MGHEAIYKCNKCGNEFKSREGGGFLFIEYRCTTCDTIKAVNAKRLVRPDQYKAPSKEAIGVCKKCGGELRDDIKPMCPRCKSRDVNEARVFRHYD